MLAGRCEQRTPTWRRLARLSAKAPKDCFGIYALYRGELPPLATTDSAIVTGPGERARFAL